MFSTTRALLGRRLSGLVRQCSTSSGHGSRWSKYASGAGAAIATGASLVAMYSAYESRRNLEVQKRKEFGRAFAELQDDYYTSEMHQAMRKLYALKKKAENEGRSWDDVCGEWAADDLTFALSPAEKPSLEKQIRKKEVEEIEEARRKWSAFYNKFRSLYKRGVISGEDVPEVTEGVDSWKKPSTQHSQRSEDRMPLSLDLLAAPVLRCLHHIRLSRIIAMLLVILIVIPLITHWYLGSVDGTSQRHDLPGLDTPGIFQDMDPKELRHHVHELHRIKSSVSNELLELESKRQRLQGSISHYNGEVEQAKVELETARNELNALKLQLRQTQKELEETMEAHRPRVAQPHRILPSENDNVLIPPPAASSSCRQHTCFDYSRCSLTSGFPVYVYPTEDSIFPLDSYIQDVTLSSLEQNLYLSSNPATACVYVVIVGTLASRLEAKDMERKLTSLPYWRGDGRNHLLINLARDYSAENVLRNIETGRAMVVQSEFMFSQYRAGFDIVIPPVFTWESGRGAFDSIPPQVPAHRKHLFSFVGEKDSP
ncbi:Exostoses (Multiple)-like 3, partial [Branchiostoma belcheri]